MNRHLQHDETGTSARHWMGRAVMCLVLFGAGVLLGGARPPHAALAQGRNAVPPQHFQSGAQQSLPVLKEIAATLKQMDARLARLETIARQLRPATGNQAAVRGIAD